MTEDGQIVGWLVFVALVILARLLTTAPARRILGPHARRLVDRGLERLNRPEEIDPEAEELRIVRRRQELSAHLDRVRRLLATDMTMSATRQAANRLAYAWLLDELARIPNIYPAMVPSRSVSLISHDPRRGSSVEILEVGWRR
jgi:hypothetical protein